MRTGMKTKIFLARPSRAKNVTKSLTVYARFIPVEVNVHINGVDQGTQNLIDVVKGTYNPGEGLEFDGWYTNANYTTKWDNKAETNDLYAKSVARITFNDGYQDVYTTTVNPGAVYESPVTHEAKTEDGAASTVEKALIWKNYMSAYDISYVNADGTAFDFGAMRLVELDRQGDLDPAAELRAGRRLGALDLVPEGRAVAPPLRGALGERHAEIGDQALVPVAPSVVAHEAHALVEDPRARDVGGAGHRGGSVAAPDDADVHVEDRHGIRPLPPFTAQPRRAAGGRTSPRSGDI